MKVEVFNVNDSIRYDIVKYFLTNYSSNYEMAFIYYMQELEKLDYDKYIKTLKVMYPIFYVVDKYYASDFSEDEEFDTFDVSGELENALSIEDVSFLIMEDPNILADIFRNNLLFMKSPLLEKRAMLKERSCDDKYLSNISKLYLLDKTEFCFDITKEELFNLYWIYYANIALYYENPEDTEMETISAMVEFLSDLSYLDYMDYSNLMDEILFDTYKYLRYKSSIEDLSIEQSKLLTSIENSNFEENLEHTLQDDMYFLTELTIEFFDYSNSTNEYKNKVDNYSNENHLGSKILRKKKQDLN